ncbi:hypothetical protein [Cupriavidus oxalaticus]|uniref:Uncharacterized protein n=1 Tax=Cupriavidus oxalaticus TaxID=96344 RepID=A0A375GF17_9BURK|nr:hypothetical protein [Cupriavidus oxalaticus]QRQ86267.1 hypothetical protein JTE91_23960 [Cupriavidus oxalaticus]QRQ95406.1 hypothetical protein JTE92_18300 [Cupriavidus oxalaticus]WQD84063.1 hypothetical protein U0036_06010 [Cupriavidus oxalaticus]SPC17376.1 conserved hypothetical protein [Cupriavidus oxalaticus]
MMKPYSKEEIELIEAAAHAAGYDVRRFRVRELEVVHVGVGDQWALFDPKRHDGDAFRLQIDCRLSVNVGREHAIATAYPGGVALTLLEAIGDNASAAVRLVITRAAAALYEHHQAAVAA